MSLEPSLAGGPQDQPISCERRGSRPKSVRDRFMRTVACAPVGLAHVALDGRWLYVNDQLCEIVGYARDELLRLHFQDITYEEDLAADLASLAELLRGERESYAMDKRYVRKDGAPVWVHLTVSLIQKPDGAPDYFIAVVENIEERKRLEDALRQAVEDRNALIGLVAHDLSTPLTVVKARAQLLRRALAKRQLEEMEHVASLEQAIVRLERQVNDLRTTAHIERGTLSLDLETFDLVALCQEAVEEQCAATGRDIHARALAVPLEVHADRTRLFQVVNNLLSNAAKYSPPETVIELAARREGEMAVVSVRDAGPGIPPEAQAHLFERYYRVPGIAPHGGQTSLGLGLYISRQLIERHGGTMRVESIVGRGSTFSFTLPLAAPPQSLPATGERG